MEEISLIRLGFSKNESKVYLSLLRHGSLSATTLAAKSGVHRTNVYDALQRLIEKGLVNFVFKEGKKFFEPANPEKIESLLKEKQQIFDKTIPNLKEMYKFSEKYKEEAHVYKGLYAVKGILNSFLKKKKPILVWGIPRVALELLGDFIVPYHKKRIKKKIVMKHIYNETSQDRIKYLNKQPYTKARYLPEEYNSPVSTNICDNQIVFILWSKIPFVIEVKNKELANAYTKYFNLLWKISKI